MPPCFEVRKNSRGLPNKISHFRFVVHPARVHPCNVKLSLNLLYRASIKILSMGPARWGATPLTGFGAKAVGGATWTGLTGWVCLFKEKEAGFLVWGKIGKLGVRGDGTIQKRDKTRLGANLNLNVQGLLFILECTDCWVLRFYLDFWTKWNGKSSVCWCIFGCLHKTLKT